MRYRGRRFVPEHICPKCFSEDIQRVPRRTFLDGMVGLFGWRVYRCQECRTRFYDRPTHRPRAS